MQDWPAYMSYFLPVWQGMPVILPELLWLLWGFKHGRKQFEIASAYWDEFHCIWLHFGQQCLKTEFLKVFSEITVSFHWIFFAWSAAWEKIWVSQTFCSYYQQDTVSFITPAAICKMGNGKAQKPVLGILVIVEFWWYLTELSSFRGDFAPGKWSWRVGVCM